MANPMRGRADYLELGDWNAVCYECGRKRKASTLLKHWQGYYVCPEHWEARHPQDFVRSVRDDMTSPWSQPAEDTFVEVCSWEGRMGLADVGVCDCAICDFLVPGWNAGEGFVPEQGLLDYTFFLNGSNLA